MNITFEKVGYSTIIGAKGVRVGEIRKAHKKGDYVVHFHHICWASRRSGGRVVKQISFSGLSTIPSEQKLRPQPYGQSCIHVRSLKLAKYIAEQVAMGYPHLLFGESK